MLMEAKLALRITTDAYDAEIASLLEAGARDLTVAGVVLPGTVSFTDTGEGIQDTSTLVDALCSRAIFTYVRMNFGSPADYDRIREAYRNQKIQLMHSEFYTDYESGGDGT